MFSREANGEICSLCQKEMHSDNQRIIETPDDGLIHADCWERGLSFAKGAGLLDEVLKLENARSKFVAIVNKVRSRLEIAHNQKKVTLKFIIKTMFLAVFRPKLYARILKTHNRHIIKRAEKEIPKEYLENFFKEALILPDQYNDEINEDTDAFGKS